MEAIIKSVWSKNYSEPDGLSAEFHRLSKKLMPTLFKLLHKIKTRTLPNSFYKVTVTLIPKPDKHTTKKENYRPASTMNINAKFLNKILTKLVQEYIKKNQPP